MTLLLRLILLPLFIRAMQSVTLEQVREAQRYASRGDMSGEIYQFDLTKHEK